MIDDEYMTLFYEWQLLLVVVIIIIIIINVQRQQYYDEADGIELND